MTATPDDKAAAQSVAERMILAVQHLATGTGDVRDRLHNVGCCDLLPLRAKEFPVELQGDFEWVMAQLTRFKARGGGEGDIQATLHRIRNSTGREIAKRIWKIFARVQEIRGRPLM